MEEKPYRSLNEYYRSIFGRKAAKISLDGGFTCPNRDGTCGTRGCLFCSAGGSGDFAENAALSITEQIAKGKAQTAGKWKNPAYIAYFQAFTNTYAPAEKLRQKYEEALACPEIEGISIATRADCLPTDVLALLAELNKKTNLWVELGLQTADAQSAAFIRRGYPLSTFTDPFFLIKTIVAQIPSLDIIGKHQLQDFQDLFFDLWRIYRACHFYPPVEISRHKIC